ncbi:hypothetical protein [Noviherbaspirillum sp.]|uniref:hypothetical protein n=1 Tax=Noviherbaspirillum sp. TaxID=1926288 RepID=UPI002B48B4CA|nr:hypothetical protein [Noviherbaspirillum sp.]HJV83187.1 hypothetical protein [Noviherbaspirillum sp.]
MRSTFLTIATLALLQFAAVAHASDVNVGVSVAGQVSPGVYGRIDIGNAPPPPVVYAQPIIIARPARPVRMAPIYLNVPPGHAKHWAKHCHKYNACGQPVYFVRSAEYENGRRGGKHGKENHGHGNGHGRGH